MASFLLKGKMVHTGFLYVAKLMDKPEEKTVIKITSTATYQTIGCEAELDVFSVAEVGNCIGACSNVVTINVALNSICNRFCISRGKYAKRIVVAASYHSVTNNFPDFGTFEVTIQKEESLNQRDLTDILCREARHKMQLKHPEIIGEHVCEFKTDLNYPMIEEFIKTLQQ